MTNLPAPDSEASSKDLKKRLIPALLEAGADAPRVLAEAAIAALGKGAAGYLPPAGEPLENVEALVDQIVAAHRVLARAEGAAAGAAVSMAETTTLIGSAGTLTVPAGVATLTGDIVGLAWIQIRMVLSIAALYGHDPRDKARLQELFIFNFNGIYGSGTAAGVGEIAGKGAQQVSKRLVLRHLKGAPLKFLTNLFRVVGIKFSRAGLIRAVPWINVPVNAVVNDRVTAALGAKARLHYSTLPVPRPAR